MAITFYCSGIKASHLEWSSSHLNSGLQHTFINVTCSIFPTQFKRQHLMNAIWSLWSWLSIHCTFALVPQGEGEVEHSSLSTEHCSPFHPAAQLIQPNSGSHVLARSPQEQRNPQLGPYSPKLHAAMNQSQYTHEVHAPTRQYNGTPIILVNLQVGCLRW